MIKKKNHIQVFEHSSLKIGNSENELTENQLKALQLFHQKNGDRYFSLIYKGIKFKEYVGALQVGSLTIEVLPKADKYTENEWQKILIGMLRAVGIFDVYAPSCSSLKIKNNSILDLYFELFINEIEYLINKGLIKKYRKTESNQSALKGNIKFAKHIQKNLVRKERFYTSHSTYNKKHLLHKILFKTILLLKKINTNTFLNSKIASLLLNFPEMKDVKITDGLFEKIKLTRKTEDYKKAIEISRLLLLNYHPNLSKGQNNVLALMFDMNLLWERFVYISLRKYKNADMTISSQTSKYFWQSEEGTNTKMRPDIVIKNKTQTAVLDTKWKNLGGKNPSSEDLRQIYVYHEYYNAEKVALIYPGKENLNTGFFYKPTGQYSEKKCSVISIPANNEISEWQKSISEKIMTMLNQQ